MQQRVGVDKLAVVLIDVDPEYTPKPEAFLPEAKKILEKRKLTWPNVLAPKGFNDTMRAFNVSGYGNIVIDADGLVRGVNLHGDALEQLIAEITHTKKASKAGTPK